ncbi:MAG: hypothetical protein ABJO27_15920 [Pseudoruegeria sp.]
MYLAYFDEANHDAKNKFTICGLTIFKTEKLKLISDEIANLREEYSFTYSHSLKSSTSTRPSHLSTQQHAEMKNRVHEIATKNGAVFVGYCKFNEDHSSNKANRNVKFGLNTLLKKYNLYLEEANSYGTVLIDRLEYRKSYEVLKQKFLRGNEFPRKEKWEPLPNIVSYGMTCNGASHLASVNDIITGSLRYVSNEKDAKVKGILVTHLKGLMWSKNKVFKEYGLSLRPFNRTKLSPNVAIEYEELRKFLNSS